MITRTLSDFVIGTEYEKIPEDAIATGRKAILDYLGVTVAGAKSSTGKIITAWVKEAGGRAEVGVIGGGFKTSPFMAALGNGTMGHALDFDDECESWNSHPSVALIPAILALGEKEAIPGKELLAAYILGWEVAARIGSANSYFKLTERGYHPTSVIGTLSATAASARLLKLDSEQTGTAFSIGASQASGLLANFGTGTKPLHAGLAASSGLRAAQLAKLGFTASANILDNPIGYFKTMTGVEYDQSNLRGLGKKYDIVPSLCIKSYPNCYGNQRAIDSVFHLIKKYDIHSDDVTEVEVTAFPVQIKVMPYSMPRTELEAKFSLQYSMTSALVYGAVGLKEYSEEKVMDPRVRKFLPKVKVVPVEGASLSDYTHCAPGQMVTIKLKDGRHFSYDSGRPKGHASNPMSWEEVAVKFKGCVEDSLSKRAMNRCMELVENFESLDNINELMSILTRAKS